MIDGLFLADGTGGQQCLHIGVIPGNLMQCRRLPIPQVGSAVADPGELVVLTAQPKSDDGGAHTALLVIVGGGLSDRTVGTRDGFL